jgi:predicted negative regulator of RcsB-dependent stress response
VSDYSEAEQYERAKEWIRTNGLWIVAGVAIGALSLGGWRWYQERRVTQAENAAARYEEMRPRAQRLDARRMIVTISSEYSDPIRADGHAAGRALPGGGENLTRPPPVQERWTTLPTTKCA